MDKLVRKIGSKGSKIIKGETLKEKSNHYSDEQFNNPIAYGNMETGEGFCRIDEIWEKECVRVIKI